MAGKPQTRFPSEVIEKIFLSSLRPNEVSLLLFIARFQFGFNKLQVCICRQSEFSYIGMGRAQISKTINSLISKKVILQGEDFFSFNLNLDEWGVSQRVKCDLERYNSLISIHVHRQSKLPK